MLVMSLKSFSSKITSLQMSERLNLQERLKLVELLEVAKMFLDRLKFLVPGTASSEWQQIESATLKAWLEKGGLEHLYKDWKVIKAKFPSGQRSYPPLYEELMKYMSQIAMLSNKVPKHKVKSPPRPASPQNYSPLNSSPQSSPPRPASPRSLSVQSSPTRAISPLPLHRARSLQATPSRRSLSPATSPLPLPRDYSRRVSSPTRRAT